MNKKFAHVSLLILLVLLMGVSPYAAVQGILAVEAIDGVAQNKLKDETSARSLDDEKLFPDLTIDDLWQLS